MTKQKRKVESIIISDKGGGTRSEDFNALHAFDIQGVINTSGATTFVARNITPPDWWPELSENISHTLEAKLPEALSKYEDAKKAREKRPLTQLWKLIVILFWIIVGAILGPVIQRLMGL